MVQVYQNGERVAEVPYVLGKKEGIEKRFKAGSEVVVQEITWHDSVRHGASTSIVDATRITDWYFYGQKVSKPRYVELASN